VTSASPDTAPSFLDAAAVGKNQWWRYVLAFIVFITLLLLLTVVWQFTEGFFVAWIQPAGLTFEAYQALVAAPTEWREAPLGFSVLNVTSLMVLVAIGTPALAVTVRWVHGRPFHTVLAAGQFDWRSAAYSAGAGAVPTILLMVPFILFNDDFTVIEGKRPACPTFQPII